MLQIYSIHFEQIVNMTMGYTATHSRTTRQKVTNVDAGERLVCRQNGMNKFREK